MLSSWLRYHIKLPDSQLPSKELTYFNATNVSIVIKIAYKFLSQNLSRQVILLLLKRTESSASRRGGFRVSQVSRDD